MTKKTLPGGIVVEFPTELTMRETSDAQGGLRAAPEETAEQDVLIQVVSGSTEFTSVVSFELEGGIGQERLGALEDDATSEDVVVSLPIESDEAAIMVSESDGVIRWEYPESIEEEATEAGGLGAAMETKRVAVFKSRYHPVVNPDEKPESLGFIGEFLLKPVKKLVFRFVARKAAESLSSYLEKDVAEGPMVLSVDTAGNFTWKSTTSFRDAWSNDGPKSVLLFVHGTFSSTEGSFGALGSTTQGKDFLNRASNQYDAIIGFDHKTLTKNVRENAAELLAAMDTLPAGDVSVDAVAFSRGGLVLRYLTETMLPNHSRPFNFRGGIFVGCTNNGTKLADPKHWKDLIDLYTNLVAGAGRVVGFVGGPNTKLASKVVSGAMRGALSFVRYVVTESTTGEAVPGLASMDPGGNDVQHINRQQPGQPLAGDVDYHIIEADFDHRLFGDSALAELGLKKRVFLEFADGFVDRLFQQAPNDLVVDRDSMSRIDPWSANDWIKDRHRFTSDAGVYHTVYFSHQQVADKIAAWLL